MVIVKDSDEQVREERSGAREVIEQNKRKKKNEE